MLVFSSDNHHREDALALWREAVSTQFVPLRAELASPRASFFAELRSRSIGPLTLSDVRCTGQHVHRDQREISRSRAERLFLNLQVEGESGFISGKESRLTRPGDLFLVDARRPFSLACETPMRHLCVAIPRDALHGRAVKWETAHGIVMRSGDTAVASLLRDYLCSAADITGMLVQPIADEVTQHVLALVDYVITPYRSIGPIPREAVRAALFAKACRIIERRMRDPEFDPATLTRECRMSLRYLQLLFQQHQTSPMREIVRRRTMLAARLLRATSYRHHTIASVAFSCGFRDLSHFGRAFFAAMGQTPREWRQAPPLVAQQGFERGSITGSEP
jgi:AraC-like DNA-binding protein